MTALRVRARRPAANPSADRPHQRTVLITGASSGIGPPTARKFRACGWTVYGTARAPQAIRPCDRIDGVTYLPLDFHDPATIQAITKSLPRVYVLINNAGLGQGGAVEDVPLDAVRELFEVNVFGPLELTRAYLPAMRADHGGTILIIGSLITEVRVPSKAVTPHRNWPWWAMCNLSGTNSAPMASAPASLKRGRGSRRPSRRISPGQQR